MTAPWPLLLALMLACAPAPVGAADEEAGGEGGEEEDDGLSLEDELALLGDELVVDSAARHRQRLDQSPSAVTVLTRDDIEASGALSLPDLLRLVPGMDVVVVTPFHTAMISRLHWSYENNAYLVLVDGREVNDDVLGQPLFESQAFSLDDIERVEVIRGPGSALYGANAFAGVVSITTRGISERPEARVQLLGGEFGRLAVDAQGSMRLGDFGFKLSAGGARSRSYAEPDGQGGQVWKLRALGEYRFAEDTRLRLAFDFSDGQGRLATGIGPALGRQRSEALLLGYDSPSVRAQLSWTHQPVEARLDQPISLAGIALAEMAPVEADEDSLDAQVQWTLPTFHEPLMLMVGAAGRANGVASDQFLDPATFADPLSPRYHRAGFEYWEYRAGSFAHAEWRPAGWAALTAGLRYDYSSGTGSAWSPRLALVLGPFEGHSLRLAGGRGYRRPSFLESRMHVDLAFPESSPLGEAERTTFRELMLRVVGNERLGHETITSGELGYLAVLLDGAIRVGLDLYYTYYEDMNDMVVRLDTTALLDSTLLFEDLGQNLHIFGSELSLRYEPVEGVSLLAGWAYKEVWPVDFAHAIHPRNQFTLGGRFLTGSGLLGSLYAFFKSGFDDFGVDNPAGLLEPRLTRELPDSVILIGRLGQRLRFWDALEVELGLKLFLPFSFGGRWDVVYERGGGVTPEGRGYGGEPLPRVVCLYLEGSY